MGCRKSASATVATVSAFQNFPAIGFNIFPVPPGFRDKTEFDLARLISPSAAFGRDSAVAISPATWRQGGFGAFSTMEDPRSDRHLLLALPSLGQAVNIEESEHYHRVETGHRIGDAVTH